MYNQFKMDFRGMSEIKLVQSMLIFIVNTIPELGKRSYEVSTKLQ